MNAALDALLEAARARGVLAEVTVRRQRQQEVRASAGAVDIGVARDVRGVSLRVWAHGGESTLSVTGSVDASEAVGIACELARRLPPRPPLPPPVAPPAQPAAGGTEPAAGGGRIQELGERLSALSTGAGEEVWVVDRAERIAFGRSDGGSVTHDRSLASGWVRVRTEGARGPGFSQHGTAAPSASALLSGPVPRALQQAREEAAALASAADSEALPPIVVLAPQVAAGLLGLAAHGFLADAVVEQRSRLADLRGEAVASAAVTLVDDATLPAGPLRARFDDEGSPTAPQTLVDRGVLRTFLSDRRTSTRLGGVRPGGGWAPGGDAPRPAASNLYVAASDGDRPVGVSGPALWIVQSHGMHIANPITGAFSFGAAGVVRDGGVITAAVREVTVAGNVYDALRAVRAVGGDLRFVAAGACYGSPSLAVEGLTVGR